MMLMAKTTLYQELLLCRIEHLHPSRQEPNQRQTFPKDTVVRVKSFLHFAVLCLRPRADNLGNEARQQFR